MTTAWRAAFRLTGLVAAWAVLCGAPPPVHARQPPDPAVLQQRAKEGERALAEGRYLDAQKAYESLRQLSPGTAEVHARLGLIYFQQGKFAEAIPPLREAIKLKPGLPKVDALLGMSLSELGRYEEALPAVTKAFSQDADPVLRRMAGLHLQRIYTGLGRDHGCRRRVAAALAPLPRRPRSALSLRPAVRELRLSADHAAGERRAGFGVAAPGRGRSQREPGPLRRRAPRIPAGARGRPATPGHPLPYRPRPARAPDSDGSATTCSMPAGRSKTSSRWIRRTPTRPTSSPRCIEKRASSSRRASCSSRR